MDHISLMTKLLFDVAWDQWDPRTSVLSTNQKTNLQEKKQSTLNYKSDERRKQVHKHSIRSGQRVIYRNMGITTIQILGISNNMMVTPAEYQRSSRKRHNKRQQEAWGPQQELMM